MRPTVAAVIPTYNRPNDLVRAVESVLAQTRPPDRIVVVIDGEVAATAAALAPLNQATMDGKTITVVETGGVGGSAARNRGVEAAETDYVAFLDDDDLWAVDKIERQLADLVAIDDGRTLGTTSAIARHPTHDEIWPFQPIAPGQTAASYLFDKRQYRPGNVLLQTSTFMARRDALLSMPFDESLPGRQDWDLVVRWSAAGRSIHHLAEPLSVWHTGNPKRASTTTRAGWVDFAEWLESRRELLGERAFAGACHVDLAHVAARDPSPASFVTPLRMGLSGRWRLQEVARYPAYFLVPPGLVRRVRSVSGRLRPLGLRRGQQGPVDVADGEHGNADQ